MRAQRLDLLNCRRGIDLAADSEDAVWWLILSLGLNQMMKTCEVGWTRLSARDEGEQMQLDFTVSSYHLARAVMLNYLGDWDVSFRKLTSELY